MASLNKVFLIGNLTREPDLRGTQGGSSVCEMGIAVNRRYTSNGQTKDETVFVDVTVWGKIAESCHRNLAKGSQIMVEGRLTMDQWQDRNTGERRSKLMITAENIQFLGRKPEAEQRQPQPQYQQSRRPAVDTGYAPPPMPDDGEYPAQDDMPF